MTYHISRRTLTSASPSADAAAVPDGGRSISAEQSAREARALAEIVQRINQSLELDRVFALIARHGAELLGASGSRLAMLDGEHLIIVAAHGAGDAATGERIALSEAFSADCIRSRRPTRTTDLVVAPERWVWSARHAPATRPNAVAVPLLVGDRAIGTLVVVGNMERDFDEHDEELLLALASHAAIAIENARLFRASVRTMRHASILASAARSLALNHTPAAMYADIARIAYTSLGADGITVFLADPDTHTASLALRDGVGAGVSVGVVRDFWNSRGATVVRTGSAQFRARIPDEPHDRASEALLAAGIASVALIPLLVEGRPRGLLALRFTQPQPFESEQRQLLTDFGTHAAVALRNALQLAALEQRAGRLAAVATVQRAISAAGSLDAVYSEIYRAVASVVDAPCFTLMSFDESERAFVPEYVVNDGDAVDCASLPRLPLGGGATSQTFLTGQPSIAARSANGWTGHTHELPGAGEIAVVLSAPIIDGERVLGVLQAQSYDQDAYGWDDVDIIMLVARQAGTAIVRARAYEAERRARVEAEAAFAIARVALGASSVDAAARAMLAALANAVPGGASFVGVVESPRTFRIVAAAPGADVPSGITLPFETAEGTSSAAAVLPGAPGGVLTLRSRDRVIGVLGRARAADSPAVHREHATLARLAAHVALALDSLLMREEEERKRHRDRTLATALETMRQPVFICSTRAVIEHANGAAVREFGYTLDELVGMHTRQLTVHPADQHQSESLHTSMRTAGVWEGELLHCRKDGTEFPAIVTMSAIRDDDERVTGVVAIVRDLTEERRIAEQLRQSEKLVALGELVAGVAHEVNNPLTGISAFAQLLQDEVLTADQRESVQMIKREADRAVTVVRDLLTFARKTGPRIVPVALNELVEQTLRLRTYGLRTAGVTVELHLAPALPQIHGDDRQLQQVLLNLIVNAEHAMATAQRRRLTIRTSTDRERVVVEVADTGIGMTPDVQKRIFEPFFTTKSDGKGTGLGLSVSYGIVQTHGGTLSVHSAPGAGATFRIALPVGAPGSATPARRAV